MRQFIAFLGSLAFCFTPAVAGAEDAIFEAGDHCVAYRTIKEMFFGFDTEIVGRSCEVTAALVAAEDGVGSQIVVTVPVKSFDSGNFLRDGSVSELLGAEVQPDLRFVSNPIDVEALRGALAAKRFVLPGSLRLAGRAYRVDFPLEVAEIAGRQAIVGRLPTTFEAFEIEVPTVAGGLIARPHEDLELVVHLDVARVEGLVEWARAQFPEFDPNRAPPASSPRPDGSRTHSSAPAITSSAMRSSP